ncbi:cholecystokinin receptor-like [Paramacrobiotus metropolitanus]|uniref:cholecystokinin receptor-like n=1 Tax=Paramacrobiotus metropolitanus TaxID=2943436 RepID=UPI002445DFAD|nr:cholecystokinin receptor-like [Paramacrobiotus metropolitanus]
MEQSVSLSTFYATVPYVSIILAVAITCANGVVLAAFFVNRHLRTPFNCYLISLILSDIGQAALDMPFTILSGFQPVWPLGHVACNFNLYAKWVYVAAVRNTHALISLNRIWALFWPVSYKHYHTKSTAIWLCVGTWVYVHVWLMPGLVPDAMVWRKDDGTCFVNTTAQPVWAMTTQMCLYNLTLVIITVTYPFIWWKIRQRRKLIVPRVGFTNTTSCEQGTTQNGQSIQPTCGPTIGSVATEVDINNIDEDEAPDTSPNIASGQSFQKTLGKGVMTSSKSSQSFAVLTYLVLGVVFCWTPIMTFFTVADFTDFNNNLLFIIGSLLYYSNSLLDPIFFCIAIRPLRATVLGFFHRRNLCTCN